MYMPQSFLWCNLGLIEPLLEREEMKALGRSGSFNFQENLFFKGLWVPCVCIVYALAVGMNWKTAAIW